MAQRLVRAVCPDCKTTQAVSADTLAAYGVETSGRVRVARGRGCSSCYDSGYRGRRAIQELVEVTPELQRLIASNPSRVELDAYVQDQGLKTLLDDGMQHVVNGDTTIEEILRAVNN
jgi:type IV pilus assembly protein PilB